MVYKKLVIKRKGKKKMVKKLPFSKRQISTIKRINRNSGETKYIDYTFSNSDLTISTQGLVGTNIFDIDQGDGVGNREGNSIFVKGLQLRGHIINTDVGITNTSDNRVRMVVFWLKNNIESSITSGDWYSYYKNSPSLSPSNFHLRDSDIQYKLLMDTTFNPQFIGSGNDIVGFKKYISLNKKIFYDGPTGSTDLKRGDVVVGIYTENSTMNRIRYVLQCRLLFKDN